MYMRVYKNMCKNMYTRHFYNYGNSPIHLQGVAPESLAYPSKKQGETRDWMPTPSPPWPGALRRTIPVTMCRVVSRSTLISVQSKVRVLLPSFSN